ncbi:MAG: chemotaxis protein CheB [Desulfobacterales bacterium]|nr:chemotaxis protein CheB [Desulfobacterales bacterium]MBF0397808.1 chemotaxis protein CheB [Desulfobacterales bacterium]
MINVLIVDDSMVARELLIYILSSDPDIQIIGAATSGEMAIEFVKKKKPDVITMDINMGGINGFETTRLIMQSNATPIVIVSAVTDHKSVESSFHAMQAGAVAIEEKPYGPDDPDYKIKAQKLINTVKLMSEIKVVTRCTRAYQKNSINDKKLTKKPQIIAIGVSTGGPPVLQTILSKLPSDFSIPILIVQHISQGFLKGMAEWLEQTCLLPIHIASHGKLIEAGSVYMAPDDFHMGVNSDYRILLSKDKSEYGTRPSISYLFRSINKVYGGDSVAVLLTGMGEDGANELLSLKKSNAITIVQDENSCAVYGMPCAAIKLSAETYVLNPEKIAEKLIWLVKK